MSAHTPEPWPTYDGTMPIVINVTDYERARACVAACAGMSDPEAEIAWLRERAQSVNEYAERMHAQCNELERERDAVRAERDALLTACQTFSEWLRREDAGFGVDRDSPGGEAAWREWYEENLRLCGLAQEQVRAALARSQK